MEGPSTLFDNWTQFVKEYVWADKMSPHNTQVDRETLKKLLQYSHFTSYFVNVCHGVSLWLSFVNSLSDYEIISDIWWNVGSIFIFSPFLNNLSLSFFLIFSYDLQATYKPTWNTTACITENLMENVTRCVCPLSGTYIVLMAKRNVNVSFIYFRLSIFNVNARKMDLGDVLLFPVWSDASDTNPIDILWMCLSMRKWTKKAYEWLLPQWW